HRSDCLERRGCHALCHLRGRESGACTTRGDRRSVYRAAVGVARIQSPRLHALACRKYPQVGIPPPAGPKVHWLPREYLLRYWVQAAEESRPVAAKGREKRNNGVKTRRQRCREGRYGGTYRGTSREEGVVAREELRANRYWTTAVDRIVKVDGP